MPDHVHLLAVPASEDGLRRAIGEAHRRYTRRINFRERWRGHLWQGRFASFVMDEPYLLAAARCVEINPVRAGLATAPSDYPWSSGGQHRSRRHIGGGLAAANNGRRLASTALQQGGRGGLEGFRQRDEPDGHWETTNSWSDWSSISVAYYVVKSPAQEANKPDKQSP